MGLESLFKDFLAVEFIPSRKRKLKIKKNDPDYYETLAGIRLGSKIVLGLALITYGSGSANPFLICPGVYFIGDAFYLTQNIGKLSATNRNRDPPQYQKQSASFLIEYIDKKTISN